MKSLTQISMIGNPAPDFTLSDQDERLVSLSDFKGQWVILYFYPKDMTSGCTLEAQEFRDHEYELEEVNAVVLGVSADTIKSHKEFCDNQSLNFTLLSDPDAEVCKTYDVWRAKAMFGTKQEGIERATFLIDPEGKIAKLYSRVKPMGHAASVIKDLRKLQSK